MVMLYSHLYANPCHNGFINAATRAKGQLAWSRALVTKPGEKADARVILCAGKSLIVEGIKQIFVFSSENEPLWRRPKWYGTPVILENKWIFYVSESRYDHMEAVDLQNKFKVQEYRISDMHDDSYLVLFEPNMEGLIAQVQYTAGGRLEEGPDFLSVYKKPQTGIKKNWYKMYPEKKSPLIPLLSRKHRRLITSIPGEALVFDIDSKQRDPQPLTFPLPVEETMWVSCGDNGQLYWTGLEGGWTAIAVTDLKGNIKWRWNSEKLPHFKQDRPVAPPIVTFDRSYLLTGKNLVAVKEGRMLWSFESKGGEFTSATALADNSVLVADGKKLCRIDAEGKSLFEVTVEETIVTPPVIDENGYIYAASSETLYAIH